MRWSSLILALALTALSAAAPAPAPAPGPAPAADPSDDSKPEIIEIIAPANPGAQETLASLDLGAPGSELGDRSKRTIGILRQLFPQLTQILEQKVQQLTSVVLQTFGPVVLRAFLGNRGGEGGNAGGGGGTVELSDDDSDEDETRDVTTEAGDERRRRRALPNVAADENQLLSGAESQQAEVRVAFGEGGAAAEGAAAGAAGAGAEAGDDQQAAAQTNSASIDEISLDDADASGEDRNKRFLSFGGSGGAGGGGGSGNFLFDIVRLVAGSSSGSSGGDAGAESEGDEASAGKGDNLTEGVPGPITRLFIIANRGIANLVQDLILRLAQTSERIVNFKARLITSII